MSHIELTAKIFLFSSEFILKNPKVINTLIFFFYTAFFLLYSILLFEGAQKRLDLFEKSFGSSLSYVLYDAVNDSRIIQVANFNEKTLLNFAQYNPQYSQVRVIDYTGQELIRVNREGEKVSSVSASELQNKFDRYYFTDLINSTKAIYTSELDYNIERGEVQKGVITLRIGRKYPEVSKVFFLNISDQYFTRFVSNFDDIQISFNSQDEEASITSLLPFSGSDYVKRVELKQVGMELEKLGVDHKKLIFYLRLNFSRYRFLFWLGFLIAISAYLVTFYSYRSMIKSQGQGIFYTNLYRQFIDDSFIFSMTDLKGRITYVNKKFCEISGYTAMELLGKDHRVINSSQHHPDFFKKMWRTISEGRVFTGQICNRKKNGDLYWVNTQIGPLKDDKGNMIGYAAVRYDMTYEKRLEKELAQHRDEMNQTNDG